jgi:hypothetical protein
MSQPGDALGYLALLRDFVRELEAPAQRSESLRGLVAPETPAAEWASLLAEAERAERQCLASR